VWSVISLAAPNTLKARLPGDLLATSATTPWPPSGIAFSSMGRSPCQYTPTSGDPWTCTIESRMNVDGTPSSCMLVII